MAVGRHYPKTTTATGNAMILLVFGIMLLFISVAQVLGNYLVFIGATIGIKEKLRTHQQERLIKKKGFLTGDDLVALGLRKTNPSMEL